MTNQLDLFSTAQKIPNSAPGLFFNTTNLTGHVLKERQFRAESQSVTVLNYFIERPSGSLTPSEVWQSLRILKRIDKKVPLTSIRRAMSSLTKRGKLIKLDGKDGRKKVQRTGIYGDLEFAWRLK